MTLNDKCCWPIVDNDSAAKWDRLASKLEVTAETMKRLRPMMENLNIDPDKLDLDLANTHNKIVKDTP